MQIFFSFFFFLKGDYEGENVEPNDRKVSWYKGGLTRFASHLLESGRLPRFHRKYRKKALNAKQQKYRSTFQCLNLPKIGMQYGYV